jgi:hypothetical protein
MGPVKRTERPVPEEWIYYSALWIPIYKGFSKLNYILQFKIRTFVEF